MMVERKFISQSTGFAIRSNLETEQQRGSG